MSRIEFKQRTERETIYDRYRPFSNFISNTHKLYFGLSGHGKSITIENVTEEYFNHKRSMPCWLIQEITVNVKSLAVEMKKSWET